MITLKERIEKLEKKIESSKGCLNGDICNRKLLRKIENGEINIRNVMRYAFKKELLPKEQWLLMDISDSWKWLLSNPISYDETELEETFEQTHGKR